MTQSEHIPLNQNKYATKRATIMFVEDLISFVSLYLTSKLQNKFAINLSISIKLQTKTLTPPNTQSVLMFFENKNKPIVD